MLITEETYKQFLNAVKEGERFVIPQRKEQWRTFCWRCLEYPPLRNVLLNYIFKIMKILNSGENALEEALRVDDMELPDNVWKEVVIEVAKFSPLGIKFAEKAVKVSNASATPFRQPFNGENLSRIARLAKENARFSNQNENNANNVRR